jgi:hypothetical protein
VKPFGNELYFWAKVFIRVFEEYNGVLELQSIYVADNAIELSVKSSKESIEIISLLKSGNKVVEVG